MIGKTTFIDAFILIIVLFDLMKIDWNVLLIIIYEIAIMIRHYVIDSARRYATMWYTWRNDDRFSFSDGISLGIHCTNFVMGETCYTGEGSLGSHSWHWFQTARDPCQCTKLEYIAKHDGTKILLTANIDKIREMLHVSCEPGKWGCFVIEVKLRT